MLGASNALRVERSNTHAAGVAPLPICTACHIPGSGDVQDTAGVMRDELMFISLELHLPKQVARFVWGC